MNDPQATKIWSELLDGQVRGFSASMQRLREAYRQEQQKLEDAWQAIDARAGLGVEEAVALKNLRFRLDAMKWTEERLGRLLEALSDYNHEED
jgi:hypothetical protein